MSSPENKARLFGREVDPRLVGYWGLLIIILGMAAGNELQVAVPLVTLGVGAIIYSNHKMSEQERTTHKSR